MTPWLDRPATWAGARRLVARAKALPLAVAGLLALVALQAWIVATGWGYWMLPDAARRDHPLADVLDPGGGGGQLLGLAAYGTLLGLLLYSLRKRLPMGTRLPPTRRFLQLHAVAGVLAPLLVLEHCGLRFGGLPGVAALGLLVVAATGLVGFDAQGRLAAISDRARDRGLVSTDLLRRASVGADPDHPGVPDPAVLSALQAFERLPLRAIAPYALPAWELRGVAARRRIARALDEREGTGRVRRAVAGELLGAVRARRTYARAESARRLLRWWRILHVALSHAVLVLATLHAGIALTYSGTWTRVRSLLGG